jgi:hypothetical protein
MPTIHPHCFLRASVWSRAGWFRLTFFLLLFLRFALDAVAQSGSPQITELMRQGQSALDGRDFSRAAQEFEQARQLAPENLEVNRGLVLS